MNVNAELKKILTGLQNDTASLETDDALALIDEKIDVIIDEEYIPHLQVYKSEVLWAAGRTDEAVDLLERCASEYDDIDSAQYFSGERLVELGRFSRAIGYLSRCIELSEAGGDSWFADSAYLLRAYCAAKTGKNEMARQDLLKVDDHDALAWLDVTPEISKPSIERMLDG